MDLDELFDDFDVFDDWMDKYRYIIELGKELPELPEDAKVAENKVLGCQSSVWLLGEAQADGTLAFRADSDAHIVRGLVRIVLALFDGKPAAEIAALDPRPTFARLGLDQHLSPGRNNGLLSMVGKIKEIAAAA